MKTTEEEEQQNEIKLAYECIGMDKQTKNPKVVQKHLQYPTKTQLHKRKLVISVKNANAQFIFPCFRL